MNTHLKTRLEGLQQMLLGVHRAGSTLSNASKGNEREAFINAFLADVLPPQFRLGTGDVINQRGNKSGQLDIVIEYPFVPSLPLVAGRSPRLYLAEGVVAVVEIKSNVAAQWEEVVSTAKRLSVIKREYGADNSIGPRAGAKVPFYAVGYTGWKELSTLKANLAKAPEVNGILVIDSGCFAGGYNYLDARNETQPFQRERDSSALSLWALITCIHHAGSMITSTTKDVPGFYLNDKD